MSQLDIVRIIQRRDTWGSVMREDSMIDEFSVKVFFKSRSDAEAFKVELMMIASGQHGYEKDGHQQNAGDSK